MSAIKSKIDKNIPAIIEKIGCLLSPFILNFTKENNRVLIFYFHGIYESISQKELNHIDPQNNITVGKFIEFIEYFLHHNYIFIKPEDLLHELNKDQPYAMITFDDGYFNNTLAIDVLNKYRIPAVIFITTNNVYENKSFWWDIIYKYRIKEHKNFEVIRKEQSYLKKFKHEYIENYIEKNFGTISNKPWSDIDRPFNSAELYNISKNPLISIGNHTHNHAILTNYNDDEIKEEFSASNKFLFELTGSIPISMAFPNGNVNPSVLNIAEEAGFKFAFTTQNDVNILPSVDSGIISLNRFMTKNTNITNYGNFARLGTTSDMVYLKLKKKIMFFKGK